MRDVEITDPQIQTLHRPTQTFHYCFGFALIAPSVVNARNTSQRLSLLMMGHGTLQIAALRANIQNVKTAVLNIHVPRGPSNNDIRLMNIGTVAARRAR